MPFDFSCVNPERKIVTLRIKEYQKFIKEL